MAKGDIFTSPINFALQETIKRIEINTDDDKFLYEMLIRSKALWEKVRIVGLGIYGMSYEQFCDELETKRNIIFLSDEDMDLFNKTVKIISVIREQQLL